jgi:hypothetical protein
MMHIAIISALVWTAVAGSSRPQAPAFAWATLRQAAWARERQRVELRLAWHKNSNFPQAVKRQPN